MNTQATAVVDAVCDVFHVQPEVLYGRRKDVRTAMARQVAYYLMRELFSMHLREIGEVFGRDHSTVHHGWSKVALRIRTVRADREMVEHLAASLAHHTLSARAAMPLRRSRASLEAALMQIDVEITRAVGFRESIVSALLCLSESAA